MSSLADSVVAGNLFSAFEFSLSVFSDFIGVESPGLHTLLVLFAAALFVALAGLLALLARFLHGNVSWRHAVLRGLTLQVLFLGAVALLLGWLSLRLLLASLLVLSPVLLASIHWRHGSICWLGSIGACSVHEISWHGLISLTFDVTASLDQVFIVVVDVLNVETSGIIQFEGRESAFSIDLIEACLTGLKSK